MGKFDKMSDSECISLAARKIDKVLTHFINLAALDENNRIVVFSPCLAGQIPRSYAANAFNVFQHAMYDFEIVRLCALWDGVKKDKANIPTVVELIDRPTIVEELARVERAHWGKLAVGNLASADPELSEADRAAIEASENAFGEKRAAELKEDLQSAIGQAYAVINDAALTGLRNYRDKHLAHYLEVTWNEVDGPMPLPTYGYASELFEISVPIVEKLYRCITGAGFSIAETRKIGKRCAEDLWDNCTFTITDARMTTI